MNARLTFCLPLLFLACSQEPQIDTQLYGTWLVVGENQIASGYTTVELGYSTTESIEAYRIEPGKMTRFRRGVDWRGLPVGQIEYYNEIRNDIYAVTIDQSTISSPEFKSISYALKFRCNAQFLKLSTANTGYHRELGTVNVVNNVYCIKLSDDTLPDSWPKEEHVAIPDQRCSPGDLVDW